MFGPMDVTKPTKSKNRATKANKRYLSGSCGEKRFETTLGRLKVQTKNLVVIAIRNVVAQFGNNKGTEHELQRMN
jgi:hypothetical protein